MAGRRKLHEEMMGEILAGIVGGEYPEGGRLPRELDLAARHGVSRYVARECIQALRDRGVLTVRHGVGATVAARDDWHLFDPVLLEAMLSGPERGRVADQVEECRRMVWPEAAAAAARHHIRDDLERMRAAGEDEAALRDAVLHAAGNRFLRHVLVALDGTLPPPTGGRGARGRDRIPPAGALIAAVEAGDEDASRAAMRARLGRLPR